MAQDSLRSVHNMTIQNTVYRLIGLDGHPHPILDTQYDTLDSAIRAVRNWTGNLNEDMINSKKSIGIEVMTSNGSWRTILYS